MGNPEIFKVSHKWKDWWFMDSFCEGNLIQLQHSDFGSDGCGFDPLKTTAGDPAGGAYIWGLILDIPPHIAIVGNVTKHFSAILAPLINS
jgi:hypothetical protein